MSDLDLLIESAAVHGQLRSGIAPSRVAARSWLSGRAITVLAGKSIKRAKPAPWTPEEDRFIDACMDVLSDEEIGEALGRTAHAVHVRRERDLGLYVRSKRPDVMSTEQVAQGICKDGKSVHMLFDRGILPGWKMPAAMNFRLVNKTRLLMWLVNPMNWCYFDPKRIGNRTNRRISQVYDHEFWARARRLVRRQMRRWKDEWWTIGKVAAYHRTDSRNINAVIHEGKLPAVDWGNWRVLRSHATDPAFKPIAWRGRGGKGQDKSGITSAAKAFILLGAAVGLTQNEIGALMGFTEKQVFYQLKRMRIEGRIRTLIREHNLRAVHDKETGETFASWRVYAHRFPAMARKMEAGPDGRTRAEKKQITIARKKAARWREHVRKKFGVAA